LAIEGLIGVVAESAEFVQIRDHLSRPRSELLVSGLTGSQKSLYIAALYRDHISRNTQPLMIVSYNAYQADRLRNDLSNLLEPENVLFFPALETLPHEEVVRNPEQAAERITALTAARECRPVIIVTCIQALAERILPAHQLFQHSLNVDLTSRIDIHELSKSLVNLGYERVERVENPGHFAVRGGIVDLFPFTMNQPARIELFDIEVDSIRLFNPLNQRSLTEVESVFIPPACEFLYPEGDIAPIIEQIKVHASEQAARLSRLERNEEARALRDRVARHCEKLLEGIFFEGMDQYKPFFYSNLTTLVSYLPAQSPIIIDEPARVQEYANVLENEYTERQSLLLEKGRILPEEAKLYASWPDVLQQVHKHPALFIAGLLKRTPGIDPVHVVQIPSRTPEIYHGKLERLAAEIQSWRKERFRICLVISTPERGERVVEAFKEEGIEAFYTPQLNGQLKQGNVVVTTGHLETGGEFPTNRLVVLTDAEVFGRQKRRRRSKSYDQDGTRITGFEDLKDGDYVVHENHGIGRYLGVETLVIAGVHKDYLVVQYQGEDRLYVPTEQVSLLQKYIGVEGQPPKLFKLGGSEWARVKKRVKESVQEMAEGLLRLYAERETITGYAFSPDTVWQQQFEDAFAYQETPDQQRAIEEVKKDMERARPMDRLLCGDVGYGKTEVAIRAAFKAVMDGKQVAVLVPTTILAQQHGRTFEDRLSGYPIKVRVLSRFQTYAEQNAIIKGLAKGDIDIVIGTHRLLSKDIVIRDLGLVVVDEEQRFGVAQKERLKELTKEVDVLTLSATPIPRTLHMSMVGVRDMSMIETPPEDRFPIRTYVVECDEELVSEAIMREMARSGQVYFVYNRVQKIDSMAARLTELVPQARIAVAHGQMDEDELEEIMLAFYNKEYDVLLCSTIIETGMDIANVNTLIVYNADQLGLAQLYQLRGRVGRSNRVAYSYFTYQRGKVLSEDAEKRLSAIKEFTDLGSGFKIAMRDLEIRGAGNILGAEQHGFIASVGFELYCKLLEESIQDLRGQTVVQLPDPVIDLHVDAYVSDEFISDSQHKVEIYKKIIAVRDATDARDLQEELEDRFGILPPPVLNLLSVSRIKSMAKQIGISNISTERDGVLLKMHAGLNLPHSVASNLVRNYRGRITVLPSRSGKVKLRSRSLNDAQLLKFIEDVLRDMSNTWTAAGA
jgi:transcription-repair coupling factor (superfamily II helicase)